MSATSEIERPSGASGTPASGRSLPGGNVDQVTALAAVFAEFRPELERQARRFVAAQEVDDVVSDAFVRTVAAMKGGAGPTGDPVPYLMFVVRTTAWRNQRVRSREQSGTDDLPEREPHHDRTDLLDEDLAGAFGAIPMQFRRILWWTEVEGRKPAEIAENMGMSANAVSALSYRARVALRKAYAAQMDASGESRAS